MAFKEDFLNFFTNIKGTNWILIIIVFLVLVAIILILLERKFRKLLDLRKSSRTLFYRKKVKNLRTAGDPEKALDKLNELGRSFFKEAFNIPYTREYEDLIEYFKKTRRKECVSFCRLASELNYAGEEIDKNRLKSLKKILEKITVKYRIHSEEEKLVLAEEEKRKQALREERQKELKKQQKKQAAELKKQKQKKKLAKVKAKSIKTVAKKQKPRKIKKKRVKIKKKIIKKKKIKKPKTKGLEDSNYKSRIRQKVKALKR